MFDNLAQTILVITLVLVVSVLLIVGVVNLFKPTIDDNYSIKVVYVESGDTLWGFHQEYAPETNWDEWLTEVKRLNGLHSSNIKAGEYLEIYAEK